MVKHFHWTDDAATFAGITLRDANHYARGIVTRNARSGLYFGALFAADIPTSKGYMTPDRARAWVEREFLKHNHGLGRCVFQPFKPKEPKQCRHASLRKKKSTPRSQAPRPRSSSPKSKKQKPALSKKRKSTAR